MFRSKGRFLVGAFFVLACIGLLGSLAIGGAAMAYRMGQLSALEFDDENTSQEMPYRFGPGAVHSKRGLPGWGHWFGFSPLLCGARLFLRAGLLVLALMLIGGAMRFKRHAFAGRWEPGRCAWHKHHFHGPMPPGCCRDETAKTDDTVSADETEQKDETKLYKHS